MKKLLVFFSLTLIACLPTDPEVVAWETMASEITITRDDWGIAHVHGPTDAHAVFGAVFAQAEDDFHRIERNFLFSQGRLAEAYGEEELWGDLRMKLFINPTEIKATYDQSPTWLQDLMDAWAGGLNYYLHTHPETEPMVLDRFEPWMALTFSEGSIGGDIERVNTRQLEAFYEEGPMGIAMAQLDLEQPLIDWEEPRGSNGIAISPENTVNGNSLLLINPHTSFFFRSELHMSSDEGLNAYGASTWGQFFIYQGFNEHAGWMHTSSGVDNIDEYLETVVERDGQYFYIVDGKERPMQVREITVPFRTETGMDSRSFTTFRTHHGPIVRAQDGKWVATALMEEPMSALIQSWDRTKRRNLAGYRENMSMHTNSSNNTVYADSEGNIAYWHSNFVPQRRNDIDWTQPVDGSMSENDWGMPHSIDETPNVFNPPVGWIQNTNNWPYSAAGPDSPRESDYPRYFQRSGENARGIHAIRVLANRSDFTLERLLEVAYSSQMPGFEPIIPALIQAYDNAPTSNSLKAELVEQIEILRSWNYRWGVESVATSLATYWAEDMMQRVAQKARDNSMSALEYIEKRATRDDHLQSLAAATSLLTSEFGDWKIPWGEINRFQRINGDIQQPFSDSEPSIPVGFHSGRWGSLASFGARRYPGTARRYGTSGNSFVAVVEFGERVTALAVTAGGESGDPSSPHFNDQAERYATGALRPVYFYPEDISANAEETYVPGAR
ncbi:MAG TPA: acylase [Gemmatimonadetes bacterium]|nr:acylase [Gemmatimonadota bacterium]|tara:strand:- start:104 stop:2284 length:2181 start_codon:yes stop_codon:yes gene_type:complete